jgi:hypothetical protein
VLGVYRLLRCGDLRLLPGGSVRGVSLLAPLHGGAHFGGASGLGREALRFSVYARVHPQPHAIGGRVTRGREVAGRIVAKWPRWLLLALHCY